MMRTASNAFDNCYYHKQLMTVRGAANSGQAGETVGGRGTLVVCWLSVCFHPLTQKFLQFFQNEA